MSNKLQYNCNQCGQNSPKWLGKCPSCGAWNSFVEEEKLSPTKSQQKGSYLQNDQPARLLSSVNYEINPRFMLEDSELSRVLGGGIVVGSLVLIGGEPGIGKSTLLLQLALDNPQYKVLYVSGEESATQIKMRADRLGKKATNCYLLNQINTQAIEEQIKQIKPDLVIIDSVQTLYSSHLDSPSGSPAQIRQCTAELLKISKEGQLTLFLIGHITKEGQLAGPKLLEHMVDVVLQFEGDQNLSYRILRAHKNRFGSTQEIGLYEMKEKGLLPIQNAANFLLQTKDNSLSGIATCPIMEGVRALHIEIQALISPSYLPNPQRTAYGIEAKKMQMLLAVLEKRCAFKLHQNDIFLNLAGGFSVQDPAMDLAILAAIISSKLDKPIAERCCFAAEVALTGEVRPVMQFEQRLIHTQNLGYKTLLVSEYQNIDPEKCKIKLIKLKKVQELVEVFG